MGAKYHGQVRPAGSVVWPPIPATVEIGAVWGVGKKKVHISAHSAVGTSRTKTKLWGFLIEVQ